MCVDFRRLNSMTKFDSCLLPDSTKCSTHFQVQRCVIPSIWLRSIIRSQWSQPTSKRRHSPLTFASSKWQRCPLGSAMRFRSIRDFWQACFTDFRTHVFCLSRRSDSIFYGALTTRRRPSHSAWPYSRRKPQNQVHKVQVFLWRYALSKARYFGDWHLPKSSKTPRAR